MKSRNLSLLGVISVLPLLSTGCSNFGPGVIVKHAQTEEYVAAGLSYEDAEEESLDAANHCKDRPRNVVPLSNFDPGQFTVCETNSDKYKIDIYGLIPDAQDFSNAGAEYANQLCVFPAKYYAGNPSMGVGSQVVWELDVTGNPMVQCFSVKKSATSGSYYDSSFETAGVRVTFEKTNFNYVFIVTEKNRDAMRTCLKYNNPSMCPAYARGKFR